jgi:hypothetical protein
MRDTFQFNTTRQLSAIFGIVASFMLILMVALA